MKMINVLQRLAELDGQNPNVQMAKPNPHAAVEAIQQTLSEELSMDSLKYLSGVKNTLAECGMGMSMNPAGSMFPEEGMAMPAPAAPSIPASFSINATAASGDEVANMLNSIMTLAGTHKAGPVTPDHMPLDKPTTGVTTVPPMSGADSMKKMLDVMDRPEDEGTEGDMIGFGDGLGGPSGEVDIAGVGGALAGAALDGDIEGAKDGYEAGKEFTNGDTDEEYDNTGAKPGAISGPGGFDSNKYSFNPNQGGGGDRMDGNMPKGNMTAEDVTAQLFSDYQKFVTEGSKVDQNKDGKNDWEDVKIARMKASAKSKKK